MNRQQIVRLLMIVRSYDNRLGDPDDFLIAAWAEAAKRRNWPDSAAENAIHEYYADQSRALIMPGDITRAIQNKHSTPPAWWQAD